MMKKAVAIRAPKWDGTESFLAVFAVRVGAVRGLSVRLICSPKPEEQGVSGQKR